ncbi:MAG: polysaccharide deacetylase family protein [Epulopiscium sp.]|nr:polysaccharide deacetylase family protein [Candidatus Epulonipiscium sp.]
MQLFGKKIFSRKRILYAIGVLLLAGIAVTFVAPAAKTVFQVHIAKAERKLPIYCVDTPEPKVAISFDAAWGADDTDELLRILEENGVKTTFFMCGYWVDDYPEEVKKIAEAGHDLGNHSATHPHMSQLSKEQIKKELLDTHKKVYDLTGYEMDLFRPPFGEYDNKVIETARENNYHIIQWDVDSLETKINP